MARSSAEVGAIIAAKYRVIGKLGQGGMGVVLLAVHEPLGVKVAVKVIGGDGRSSADKKRFLLEAQAAAQLRGAHIARVTDFGSLDDGRQFMVMEHLEGEDLATLLARRGRIDPQEAVDLVIQACAGLAEAHATGIVHRDIKPSNLFVTHASDGAPLLKVLDFGVSKFDGVFSRPAAVAGLATPPGITSAGLAVGTPLYMSPEQIKARGVDERTDVWALGIVLFELCTGASPFFDESLGVTLVKVLEHPHGAVRDRAPEVDDGLARTIDWCLAKSAADRPESVVILAERLAKFASDDGRRLAERVRVIAERAGAREHLALTPSSPVMDAKGETTRIASPDQSATGSELPTMRGVVGPPGASGSADDFRVGDTPSRAGGTSSTSTATPGSKAVAIGMISVVVMCLAGVGIWLAAARSSMSSRADPEPSPRTTTPARMTEPGTGALASAVVIVPATASPSAEAPSTEGREITPSADASAKAAGTTRSSASRPAVPTRPAGTTSAAPAPSASQRRTLH